MGSCIGYRSAGCLAVTCQYPPPPSPSPHTPPPHPPPHVNTVVTPRRPRRHVTPRPTIGNWFSNAASRCSSRGQRTVASLNRDGWRRADIREREAATPSCFLRYVYRTSTPETYADRVRARRAARRGERPRERADVQRGRGPRLVGDIGGS